MIDAKFYCQQLENLKAALQVNRPERRKVRLLDDNARARTAKAPQQKLEEFGWEMFPIQHISHTWLRPIADCSVRFAML